MDDPARQVALDATADSPSRRCAWKRGPRPGKTALTGPDYGWLRNVSSPAIWMRRPWPGFAGSRAALFAHAALPPVRPPRRHGHGPHPRDAADACHEMLADPTCRLPIAEIAALCGMDIRPPSAAGSGAGSAAPPTRSGDRSTRLRHEAILRVTLGAAGWHGEFCAGGTLSRAAETASTRIGRHRGFSAARAVPGVLPGHSEIHFAIGERCARRTFSRFAVVTVIQRVPNDFARRSIRRTGSAKR